MQRLIRDLILQLHQDEPDPQAVILVFLPTFRSLLLQHSLLQAAATAPRASSSRSAEAGGAADAAAAAAAAAAASAAAARQLDVFALHSSVDVDEAVALIGAPATPGRRRVVLATNCAESSVTLPHVKHVIDSCTTNQLFWDASACREYARVVYCSQSAGEQRAGRTGRTCAGTCYRLLPRQAYLKLDKCVRWWWWLAGMCVRVCACVCLCVCVWVGVLHAGAYHNTEHTPLDHVCASLMHARAGLTPRRSRCARCGARC
jgi:HrpA-like RNA helicase